jgi:hypothetical protein
MAKDKRQGPRRGEYCGRPSRQSRLSPANKRINLCGWTMRKPASTATRSTPPAPFPSAPHSQSISPLSPGAPPLSEGGACSRTLHSPYISPRSLGNPPRPLSFPKDRNHGLFRPVFHPHSPRGRDARAPGIPPPSHPFPCNGPPAGRTAWILDWTRRVGPPKKAEGKPKETRCMR